VVKAQGYPRQVRLSGRAAIDAAYRRGRYYRLGILHAKALPTELATARYLISVKKAIGNSVERNRIKRLVREAIRRHRRQLGRSLDVCLFLTARPDHAPTLAEIDAEIVTLFQRLEAAR
jgi:ribonuclease P protein component